MRKLLVIQSTDLLANKEFIELCDYIHHQVDNGILILNKDVTYEQIEVSKVSYININ